MKKILTLVLTLCLLLSAVSALAEVTYPLEGDVTLTYWSAIHTNAASYISIYGETEVFQEISRKTGINIEWEHPALGSEKTAFATMMAGGDLPDILSYGNFNSDYSGGLSAAIDEGVIYDLTELLPLYAPDYWELVKDDPRFQTDDGRYAAFYIYNPDEQMDPPYRRLMTRQEWLDAAGIEAPDTIEELEGYFDWVLENLDGVTPFLLSPVGDGYAAVIWGTYDILDGWYLDLDGNVQWGRASGDNYLEYLTKMHEWYEKGYIVKDWATMSSSDKKAAYVAGTVAVAISSCDDFRQLAMAAGFEAASLPYVRKTDESVYHADILSSNKGGCCVVIPTTCKNVEAALAYLNYAYHPEGKMVYNFGVEGLSWNYDENGNPVYTERALNPEGMSAENANYIYRAHAFPKWRYSDVVANLAVVQDADAVAFRLLWTNDPMVDNALRLPAEVTLTAEESTRRAEIMTDITTYSSEMMARYINGLEDLSTYEDYIKNINKMGFEEARQITQAAYERYLASMSK